MHVKSAVFSRRFETSSELSRAGRARRADRGAASGSGRVPAALRRAPRRAVDAAHREQRARIVASADLKLRGTYDRPLLFGRAEIERGEFVFEGQRYLVTRGTLDFSNPTRIEPFFDIEAETRVRVPGQTYRVTVSIAGTTERLQSAFNSDPPLPTVDILTLLFSDTAPTDPSSRSCDRRRRRAAAAPGARGAALVSPLSAEVGRVVEQTFGVDTFQITPSLIDPTQQSSRFNPGARLTIGKRISSRAT